MHLDSGPVATASVIMSCPVIRCHIEIPLAPLALDADVRVLTWPLVVTQPNDAKGRMAAALSVHQ